MNVEDYDTFRHWLVQAVLSSGGDDSLLARVDEAAKAHFDGLIVLETASDPDEPAPPATQISAIEEGIFNLVVTLVVQYQHHLNPTDARARVAGYLERLIGGLSFDDPSSPPTPNQGVQP